MPQTDHGQATNSDHCIGHVLLVEDDEELLRCLGDYLSLRGFKVDLAADVGRALTRLFAHRPDAVVTDLDLSGFRTNEGLDLALIASGLAPAPVVLLFTAHDTPELRQRALACGVDLVLSKPLPLDVVFDTLCSALRFDKVE